MSDIDITERLRHLDLFNPGTGREYQLEVAGRAADKIERLTAEVAAHRKYLESITDNGSDYPETMDELIDLGLVVEVPPTPEFIDEWGDDCEMYVLAWSPLARRALDGEE